MSRFTVPPLHRAFADRDPFRVGLLAIAGTVLLGILVTVVSTVSFGTRGYTARFEHTGGIRVGESVQVAGVDSGKVTGIAIDGASVLVSFNLDRGIHLGSDSTAEVKVATLLGTHMLAIDPRGSGDLRDGMIPLDHTQVPYNLQDVIDKGTGALDELDSGLLGQALSTVADTLRASGPELLPALQGVDRISRVVDRRSGQVEQLLTASRKVTDQLSSSSGDLLELMRQTNLVVAELLRRRAAIHQLLVDVASLSEAVRGVIDDTKSDIGPTLDNLDRVLDVLRSRDKDITVALHGLAVGSRYLANVTGNGPWAELYVPGVPDDVWCQTEGRSGGGCK